jgi:hypothetical protein
MAQIRRIFLKFFLDVSLACPHRFAPMKTTAKFSKHCDQPGCNFTARHAQEAVAKRMLGCHKTYEHGVRSEKSKANDKYRKRAGQKVGALLGKRSFMETLASIPDGAIKSNGHMSVSGSSNGAIIPKPKRRYKKRIKQLAVSGGEAFQETAPKPQTSTVVPAYLCECPNCRTRFYMAKGE